MKPCACSAAQIGVDYYALSFVRDAEVIYELKSYLAQEGGWLLLGTSHTNGLLCGTCHKPRAKPASSLRLPHPALRLPYPCVPGLTGTSAIGVLAKIESADSVEHLDEILDAGKHNCKRPARLMPSCCIMAWAGLGRWVAAGANLLGWHNCLWGHAVHFSWPAVDSAMVARGAHLHA